MKIYMQGNWQHKLKRVYYLIDVYSKRLLWANWVGDFVRNFKINFWLLK